MTGLVRHGSGSLFDQVFGGDIGDPLRWWSPIRYDQAETPYLPKFDMIEQEDQFVIEMEAPGLTKDNLEITLEDGFLGISGTREYQREYQNDNEKIYHRELSVGKFTRRIRVPRTVDDARITASVKNGMLIVTLPKSPGTIARTIQIE